MNYIVAFYDNDGKWAFEIFHTRVEAASFAKTLGIRWHQIFVDEHKAKTRAEQAIAQYFEKV